MHNKVIEALLNVLDLKANQEFKIENYKEHYRFNNDGILEFKVNNEWFKEDEFMLLDLIYEKTQVSWREER